VICFAYSKFGSAPSGLGVNMYKTNEEQAWAIEDAVIALHPATESRARELAVLLADVMQVKHIDTTNLLFRMTLPSY